jgi:flap endonuclease-1
MGVALADIVNGKTITVQELSGKVIVVDTFNMLYQFLTTIRGADGSPLTDNSGQVTSHLVGLFSRVTKLMQEGLKLVFVFDGKAPELKKKERERRKNLKIEAQVAYDVAKDAEDVAGMKKYAGRTARLTPEMVLEAKELLVALGLPIIDAPSEGEAQAAYMVARGDAWGLISQDFDCLLFGTSRMLKNVSVTARKKKPGTLATMQIEPELIVLKDVLTELHISREDLIALGLLIGTDFNIGGIKGLGPKKGLKMIKEHKDKEELFTAASWHEYFDFPWKDAYELFLHMPVTTEYDLVWKGVDGDLVRELLVVKHQFSTARVDSVLERLSKAGKDRAQKGLSDFF